MSTAAVVALLSERLNVIFAGENADGGRHRLSAVAQGFVPGSIAKQEDALMHSRIDRVARLRFLHPAAGSLNQRRRLMGEVAGFAGLAGCHLRQRERRRRNA